MHIPRQDPSQDRNQVLQVVGVLGFMLGIYMIVITATGQAWQKMPALGYLVGFGLMFFGVWRFLRGRRGSRR